MARKSPSTPTVTDTTLTTQSVDTRGAAKYSAYSPDFFRAARRMGRGPAYIRVGRSIRYRLKDLDAWLESHRVDPACASDDDAV
jgi:hypothetical protein